MKGNPAVPGGSLTSRPAWSNAFRCSVTSVFSLTAAMIPIIDSCSQDIRDERSHDHDWHDRHGEIGVSMPDLR